MKQIPLILLAFGLFSCKQKTADNTKMLQNRIDSLEVKLANTYKPGFGDFMGSIQAHHAKLWFAGQNENWELADFEVHELMEAIEDIQEYHAGREETKLIGMIEPGIESIDKAIEQKDPALFESGYNMLTISCNQCHQALDYDYIRIKTPDSSPFSNQDFRPIEQKE